MLRHPLFLATWHAVIAIWLGRVFIAGFRNGESDWLVAIDLVVMLIFANICAYYLKVWLRKNETIYLLKVQHGSSEE